METEQFSLCWNNFHNNLSTGFNSLLQNEDLVDVTLAAEGRYLKAHKIVLSVCSPYFKELFRVNPCKHPIVILQDINYNALNSLLQFMYQGEVSVSQDEIPIFMRAAETLKIKGLTDNNSSMDTNGLSDNMVHRNSPHSYGSSEPRQIMKRIRPPKKIIKPIQHLKPLESPKTVTSPLLSKSPDSVKSPQPPPAKKSCVDETRFTEDDPLEPTIINPKQEPIDNSYDEFKEQEEPFTDISSTLDTTLGEPSHSSRSWTPDFKGSSDASTPGLHWFTTSRKGMPHLIYKDNLFRASGKSANSVHKEGGHRYWECVKNRKTGCKARLLSHKNDVHIKCDQHNHPPVSDYIQEKVRAGATYVMSL